MSDFSPDLWKEAADTWMCIWKFREGPWKVINKDVAKMIQRKIYEIYTPPVNSELLVTTFNFYKRDKLEKSRAQLEKNFFNPLGWARIGSSGFHPCCKYCLRPLLWKSKDCCRSWCPVHGHPPDSTEYLL